MQLCGSCIEKAASSRLHAGGVLVADEHAVVVRALDVSHLRRACSLSPHICQTTKYHTPSCQPRAHASDKRLPWQRQWAFVGNSAMTLSKRRHAAAQQPERHARTRGACLAEIVLGVAQAEGEAGQDLVEDVRKGRHQLLGGLPAHTQRKVLSQGHVMHPCVHSQGGRPRT